jgi:hypothetical protein
MRWLTAIHGDQVRGAIEVRQRAQRVMAEQACSGEGIAEQAGSLVHSGRGSHRNGAALDQADERLLEEAGQVPFGSEGLLCLPWVVRRLFMLVIPEVAERDSLMAGTASMARHLYRHDGSCEGPRRTPKLRPSLLGTEPMQTPSQHISSRARRSAIPQ